MNLKRLKELEKLAGLSLDPSEQKEFLADLNSLEKLLASLPNDSISNQENKAKDSSQ